jgi:predicted dehydrogenase
MFRIALVGYGYWGPNIARNIEESSIAELSSICDHDGKRLEVAGGKYLDKIRYSKDYNELFNDPEVDAVAIAVETKEHFRIAFDAINAGKHVFLEKPITTSVEDAEKLQKASKKAGVILHVDHILVYHPAIKKIHEMIRSGKMGDLIYFDSSRMNMGKIKNDVSAMWDLAVHDLAVLDFLLNGDSPEYISAVGEKKWAVNESLTYLTIKYPEFVAHFKSSWISPVKERRMIIGGTKRMVVFDDMVSFERKVQIFDKGFKINKRIDDIHHPNYIKERDGDVESVDLPIEDSLRNSIEHFVRCSESGTESITNAAQAIRVLKILEEADLQLRR